MQDNQKTKMSAATDSDRYNSPRTMWESSSRSRDKTQAPMQHLEFPSFLQLNHLLPSTLLTSLFPICLHDLKSFQVHVLYLFICLSSFSVLSSLGFFLNMSPLCFFHLAKGFGFDSVTVLRFSKRQTKRCLAKK